MRSSHPFPGMQINENNLLHRLVQMVIMLLVPSRLKEFLWRPESLKKEGPLIESKNIHLSCLNNCSFS